MQSVAQLQSRVNDLNYLRDVTDVEECRRTIERLVSLFSKVPFPPTKYRNPKTEHRVEIYLNISDYM